MFWQRIFRSGLFLFMTVCVFAFAANVKLYLKDGSYHLVNEYHVEADRVRFYSVERAQWEEIPLELTDLKKTESEVKRLEDARREDAKFQAQETKAEKDAAAEAARVPTDPGAYLVEGDKLVVVAQGESKVVKDKRRRVLQVFVPIVAGKATVELAGAHAPTVTHDASPEFYFRLAQAERFGIIHLTPKKNARVAEKVTIVPVANIPLEEATLIEVFRKQVGEDLYKVWPVKPLEPGEYAMVEFSAGELNMQIWDFSCVR
jgi:hypothetical protein